MSTSTSSLSSHNANVSCPRCKQPLVDPQGLGWCKACGYCRSLAETETKGIAPPSPLNAQPSRDGGVVLVPQFGDGTIGILHIPALAPFWGERCTSIAPFR